MGGSLRRPPAEQKVVSRQNANQGTTDVTKAQRILDLYDGKRTTTEIAKIVGCLPEYVRVVARQREGGRSSKSDRKYRTSPKGMKKKKAYERKHYHEDPAFREKHLFRCHRWYWERGGREHKRAARAAAS